MKATLLLGIVYVAFLGVADQHHPPRNAEEYARVLNDPQRESWQRPHEVVKALGLRSDETIADLGAGTGYFARRFAPHVAKVYAIDIDEKLLKIAKDGAPPTWRPSWRRQTIPGCRRDLLTPSSSATLSITSPTVLRITRS